MPGNKSLFFRRYKNHKSLYHRKNERYDRYIERKKERDRGRVCEGERKRMREERENE